MQKSFASSSYISEIDLIAYADLDRFKNERQNKIVALSKNISDQMSNRMKYYSECAAFVKL